MSNVGLSDLLQEGKILKAKFAVKYCLVQPEVTELPYTYFSIVHFQREHVGMTQCKYIQQTPVC